MGCLANTIFAYILIYIRRPQGQKKRSMISIPSECTWELMYISCTYVLSMICTNFALTHVSYPTQVLVKSAKMVPIVCGGYILYGKKYPWWDYVTVVCVTVGLVIFNLFKKTNKDVSQSSTLLGLILLAVSLFCDGLTGPRQDRLLARHKSQLSPDILMFYTNIFASIWSLILCLIFEHTKPLEFCARHTNTYIYILGFCLCACLGQVCIFVTLSRFGSLHLALVTTTRKFFTVLLSIVWFRHSLTLWQWTAVIGIFTALLMQSYFSAFDKAQKKNKVATAPPSRAKAA